MKRESIPYENQEGEEIDFEVKRLKFWLDTVPKDIRHLEYELWRRYRTLHHLRMYQHDNEYKHGHYRIIPDFTEDIEQKMWQDFSDSFLKGSNRAARFTEVIEKSKTELSQILAIIPETSSQKIKLIALTGSSVYGPRREGERLSDVDINCLLDQEGSELNFEKIPSVEDDTPYHITVTGRDDGGKK